MMYLMLYLLFLVALVGGILLIAFLAAKSRKKKQQAVLDSLPSETELYAIVRYNQGNQHQKVMKLKAFEGSGVLYVIKDIIYFRSTMGLEMQFDMKQVSINYTGETFANGLLKWFSIADANTVYYFNVESGMFIFHTGGNKPTTISIFNHLKSLQQIVLNA